jgi:epoxide hydrolase 4
MSTPPNIASLQLAGADGVTLNALTCGEGRLVLFLHGFPEFSGAWIPQLAHFGRSNLAAAIDLRGYNRSSKPGKVPAYAISRVVEDIRLVIEALSPNERAILVGHDWGGMAAWAFAREYPAVLDGLVTINAPHPAIFARELSHNPAQRFASSQTMLFRSPGVAETILSEFDYALLKRMLFRRTARPEAFTPEMRAAYVESWKQPGALRSALSYFSAAQNFAETREQVWQINVPTLVLWGEADAMFLSSNLSGLDEYVMNLTIHRHPTATHWVIHEEPEWVHGCIEEFLASRPVSDGVASGFPDTARRSQR